AVEVSPIAAAEINQGGLVAGQADQAVMPANVGDAQAQVAIGTAPDQEFSLVKRDLPGLFRVGAALDESGFHDNAPEKQIRVKWPGHCGPAMFIISSPL